MGIRYPSDARYYCKYMSQEKIYWMIIPVIVGRPTDLMLEKIPEVEKLAKLLENDQAAPAG